MADEWKLCLDWLVRCQILQENHPATQPTAQVFDLAQSLRDGVLLCHLLNRLSPGVVDAKDFSQRPQMSQFLCQKNIRLFNQICGSHFGLKETDLFATPDLFEMRDFAKVIETLSKLSLTSIALKQVAPGFSTKGRNREDVYADLSSLASGKDVNEDYYTYDSIYGERDEEIYDQILKLRQKKAAAAEQHGPEPRTKRDFCLRELIDTETNYVDALNMITQHFITPLRQLLEPKDHQVVFACIEELYDIHKSFLAEIHKATSGHSFSGLQFSLADCFIRWKEKFLIYGDFCSNLPVAQERIEALCKNDERILAGVHECEMKANNGKFHVRDLLSVPMQRVLKYALLLKELIKHTEESHPDKKSLPTALAEMQDLSMYINEVKRDNEMIQNLRNIQSCIVNLQMPDNTTLSDYGRLQLDGELKAKSHEENRYKTRYVFLFDKVMLMCKVRTVDKFLWGETYGYKDALILARYRLDDGRNLVKPKEQPLLFQLVQNDENNVITLCTKTPELRTKWMEAISMAMDNTNPPQSKGPKHDFIMHSFTTATICDVCKKLLRGVIFQGYRCIKADCGMKVHKECILKAKDLDAVAARNKLPEKPAHIVHRQSTSIPPPTPERPDRPPARSSLNKCIARSSYSGNPPPDNGRIPLFFESGSVIDLVNTDDPIWWEGRLNGHNGYFPSSLVESTRPARKSLTPSESSVHAIARRSPSTMVSVIESEGAISRSRSVHSSVPTSDVSNYPWFVGKMGRDEAELNLERFPVGTYLVRLSTTNNRQGEYALSVRAGVGVRHIRIQRAGENDYYLADCRHFGSVIELVEYYQKFSLRYSFPEVDNCLTIAYKEAINASTTKAIGYCSVQFDYAANQSNQLSIRVGDRIKITSKNQGGWWKGELNGRSGYFPSTFVIEEEDVIQNR